MGGGISVGFVVLLVGGNSNNGANSGPFYANSNNAWSNANSNIGARHTNMRIPVIAFPDKYRATNPLNLDPTGHHCGGGESKHIECGMATRLYG